MPITINRAPTADADHRPPMPSAVNRAPTADAERRQPCADRGIGRRPPVVGDRQAVLGSR
jgi:hypothetical protein